MNRSDPTTAEPATPGLFSPVPGPLPEVAVLETSSPAAVVASLARLRPADADMIGQGLALLHRQAEYDELAVAVRSAVTEGLPQSDVVGVVFVPRRDEDPRWLSRHGRVEHAAGFTNRLDFGTAVQEILNRMCGTVGPDAGVVVDLRTAAVAVYDTLPFRDPTALLRHPITPLMSQAPVDGVEDPERVLLARVHALRVAEAVARMELVAHKSRRLWPQAVSLRVRYLDSGIGTDPTVDRVRLVGVHGAHGPLWNLDSHIWSAGQPDTVPMADLHRLDAHLTMVLPDGQVLPEAMRWTEHTPIVTVPLPGPPAGPTPADVAPRD